MKRKTIPSSRFKAFKALKGHEAMQIARSQDIDDLVQETDEKKLQQQVAATIDCPV